MEFLLNLAEEAPLLLPGITGGAICALHFVSVLTKEKIAKILQYVNIVLHIFMFFVLMLSKIAIDVCVAVFMFSAFLYTLITFIKYKQSEKVSEPLNGKEAQDDL